MVAKGKAVKAHQLIQFELERGIYVSLEINLPKITSFSLLTPLF